MASGDGVGVASGDGMGVANVAGGTGRGGGHTVSLCGSGTKSRIFSKRYLLLSNGSPGGESMAGRSCGQGFQPRCCFFRRESVFSSALHCVLTIACPGAAEEKTRWCHDLMPSKAPLLK